MLLSNQLGFVVSALLHSVHLQLASFSTVLPSSSSSNLVVLQSVYRVARAVSHAGLTLTFL